MTARTRHGAYRVGMVELGHGFARGHTDHSGERTAEAQLCTWGRCRESLRGATAGQRCLPGWAASGKRWGELSPEPLLRSIPAAHTELRPCPVRGCQDQLWPWAPAPHSAHRRQWQVPPQAEGVLPGLGGILPASCCTMGVHM